MSEPPTLQNNTQPAPTAACLLCPDDDDDDGMFNPFRHLEIVGLHISNNGRSCDFHDCCGCHMQVRDLLHIKKTLVDTTDGITEEALCCVLINEGNESCRDDFIPRFLCKKDLVLKNINRFLQVVELFDESDNTAKQQKSSQCGGVAGVIIIDKIPILE